LMFVASIDAVAFDDEGEAILDGLEDAHKLSHEPAGPTVRRYTFSQFKDDAAAIGWLEAEAVKLNPRALDEEHVQFGKPGKNAP
jgi:hypothetical protein